MDFTARIELRDRTDELAVPVATARDLFQKVHPGEGFGFPSRFDYARYSYVYDRACKGGAVLDVGVGSGQLLNAFALGGEYRRVTGIDIKRHSRYEQFVESCELLMMDVSQMDFHDEEFDVVICMEVLEHLEQAAFPHALSELRRVCSRQLLMSVPYDEPEPLPPYHKMSFGDRELQRYFPDAELILLSKPGVSWVLIEEMPFQNRSRLA